MVGGETLWVALQKGTIIYFLQLRIIMRIQTVFIYSPDDALIVQNIYIEREIL